VKFLKPQYIFVLWVINTHTYTQSSINSCCCCSESSHAFARCFARCA